MFTPTFRIPRAAVALGLIGMLSLWLAVPPSGLTQPKKPPREEVEDTPPPKKGPSRPPREEVEEPIRSRPKVPIQTDGSPAPAEEEPVDLGREAGNATNPAVKALFEKLAVPHDEVVKKDGEVIRIAPLNEFLADQLALRRDLTFREITAAGKPGAQFKLAAAQVRFVRHYEQIALKDVADFLAKRLETKPLAAPDRLPVPDQLTAAVLALKAAREYHAAAREQLRAGPGWDRVRAELRERLVEVRGRQLKAAIDAGDDDAVIRILNQLGDDERDGLEVLQQIGVWQVRQTERLLKSGRDEDYKEARVQLDRLEREFPRAARDPAMRPLRAALRDKATALMNRAAKARDDGKKAESLGLLALAKAIDPELPGLTDQELRLSNDYPILYVGVPRLPERMSPPTAVTDAERMAVDLVFESLVVPTRDPATGGRLYRPGLALTMPRLVPMGREFRLVPEARWSNGKPVTVFDVRESLTKLQERSHAPTLDGLDRLSRARDEGDELRVLLTRGVLEPLAAMTFKVMPPQVLGEKPADDADFARNPVGSGPYLYAGREQDQGREVAVFRANPLYEQRPGKHRQPFIREVRFVSVDTESAEAIKAGRLHLLAGISTQEDLRLRSLETGLTGLIHEEPRAFPRHHRIHLLALNHRTPSLQRPELRRLLSYAIDRTAILDSVFRAGTTFHSELTGPFPPRTWPLGTLAGPLHRPTVVPALASKLGVSKDKPMRALRLCCPDDSLSRTACDHIKTQIEGFGVGIELEVIALPEAELRDRVVSRHDYDLAYLTYDFTDDSFWLGGLLDPQAAEAGGRNYMGCHIVELENALAEIGRHREFTRVRTLMHQFHRDFNDVWMPFVPLWQLDIHIVLRREVLPEPALRWLDPLAPLAHAAEWRFGKKK